VRAEECRGHHLETIGVPVAVLTWEEAVEWLRSRPEYEQLVRDCYYDDPLVEAAKRFSGSQEWDEVRRCLPATPGRVLDVGAGRGIGSYALAVNGWRVTALEYDPSPLVGRGAISRLSRETGLSIEVVAGCGEALPFARESMDVVYVRAVLHHLQDVSAFFREVDRVLRPGGMVIATREHVLDSYAELAEFQESHPLHRLYGGEKALLLEEYLGSIRQSGLTIVRVVGPFDSAMNYYPMSSEDRHTYCCSPLFRFLGYRGAMRVTSESHHIGRWLLGKMAARRSAQCHVPGRLYSFIGKKRNR